ncbi:transporter substrate-binding domain-containing protein [Mesorhizobium sp. J428]|uniref:transporter substrate-binding domain-containing protein n=1 Tax=Mesorhizobium sp. J428 TaxID=2898440 RepID=UPI0021515C77|nr:transporter substrate-binding domain-containing protein [Mesorhizobium sp. J428]MCR5857204.1 transporter substrate-binding domain-containing protein [Mesorhizobium sp. J428]
MRDQHPTSTSPDSATCQLPSHVIYAFIDEPPFGAPGPDGKPVGYDYSVAEIILRRLGIERIDSRLVTFGELIPGVVEGKWAINTGMFVTPGRSKQVIFSRPIWALIDGFVVQAGNPKRICSYEDAARDRTVTLGVVEGNVQIESALASGIPEERLRRFKSQHEVVREVIAGNVDAYPGAALAHRGFLTRLNAEGVEVVDIAPGTQASLPLGAFSFGSQNLSLTRVFDRELKSFLGSPEHLLLAERHGLSRSEIDPILDQ